MAWRQQLRSRRLSNAVRLDTLNRTLAGLVSVQVLALRVSELAQNLDRPRVVYPTGWPYKYGMMVRGHGSAAVGCLSRAQISAG